MRDERNPTTGGSEEVRSGLYHRAFAWLLGHGDGADRRMYAERKTPLLAGLTGTVVEIGPGSGVNLDYIAPTVRYRAVEPNIHFHEDIGRRAERLGIEATVQPGVAERLPFPDDSADTVISTLVLCSVADQRAALKEVLRVLRPGGRFLFVEHVVAPEGSSLWFAQRALRRPWGWIADGCRPDCDTGAAIRSAGFSHVDIEPFSVHAGLVSPHIAGTARKPG